MSSDLGPKFNRGRDIASGITARSSFDAMVRKHGLTRDPAIVLPAKIVNGADTDNSLWNQPEAAGLNAIAEGFRHLGFKDDPK